MTAIGNSTRILILAIVAALAIALAAPAIDQASAAPNNGGGDPPVTCKGGAKVGEVWTKATTMTLNGKTVQKTVSKSRCGADGEWHEVALFVTQSGGLHGQVGTSVTKTVKS
jgi:hypothetical protein